MPKPIFKTSDARITSDKIEGLQQDFRDMADLLNRIQIEVELLRQANHEMAKTIKNARYKG